MAVESAKIKVTMIKKKSLFIISFILFDSFITIVDTNAIVTDD